MKQRRKKSINDMPEKSWKILNLIDQESKFMKTNKELSVEFQCNPKTITYNFRILRDKGLIEESYEIIPTGLARVVKTTEYGHIRNLTNPLNM